MQHENADAPGYIPEEAVAAEGALCRRCFRIRNYGEFTRVAVSPAEYTAQVARISDDPGLVLYVMDVFDLSGSLVSGLARFTVGCDVVVVVNKTDVLPSEVSPASLEAWVRSTVEASGVNPVHVCFVSAEKNRGISELAALIGARRSKVVYAVGMANVGKSSVLNRLLSSFGMGQAFTASRVPGTTLGMVGMDVALPTGATVRVVDTPGLIHGNRITDALCVDCLKASVPLDKLRPRVYQLDAGQTLWLGGFCRVDFVGGPHQSVVCYVSNRLAVHRTKSERAETIYQDRYEEVLHTPCALCQAELGDLLEYEIVAGRVRPLDASKAHVLRVGRAGGDIVLAGLGWVALQGDDFHGRIWLPRGIDVSVRPKLVGGHTVPVRRHAARGVRRY